MLIIPFDIQNDIRKFPIVTFVITLFCVIVFIFQEENEAIYEKAFNDYCDQLQQSPKWLTMKDVQVKNANYLCVEVMLKIMRSENKKMEMMKLAQNANPSSIFLDRESDIRYTYQVIEEAYQRFQKAVPPSLREEWMYQPLNYKLSQFFTSAVSHANFYHLSGNMLFFLVFSCTLELLIGRVAVILFYVLAKIVSSLSYSYAVYIGFDSDLPSLGLSGVISGAMALLAVLLPWSKISIVIWSGFFVLPIRLPLFLLVGWYIYWDYYYMKLYGAESCVGYVAHLGGAATGIIVGVLCRFFLNSEIQRRARLVKGL